MKNVILCFFFLPALCFSQIGERKIAEAIITHPSKYDPSENFKHHHNLVDYKMYIGQEFYVIPANSNSICNYKDEMFGKCLIYKTPKPYKTGRMKKERYMTNYKAYDNHITPYDSVAGKTFKVIGFDENLSKKITDGYNELYFLLLEKNESDTLIWTPKITHLTYPFSILILSYLEKIKKDYIGKYFFAKKTMLNSTDISPSPPYYRNLVNINTGNPVSIDEAEIWVCNDVSLLSIFTINCVKEPMMIFENSKKQEIAVSFFKDGLGDPRRKPSLNDFMTIERFNLLKNEYGEEVAALILTQKVRPGMTDKMCIESWGHPIEVNKAIKESTVYELWVYKNVDLYFENGKLISIEN